MKPGRELDTLIAEKVMGYHYKEFVISSIHSTEQQQDWYNGDKFIGKNPPNYSTNISAAWEIIEKLKLVVFPPFSTIKKINLF